ncbi:MAG: hypothetical protein OXP69_07475 [Spirochaetaceae bacterium]|nr:hypothetical protein [Spirochaetaceae bacterium]
MPLAETACSAGRPRGRQAGRGTAPRRHALALAAAVCMLGLASCISIESRFTFDADGSGELQLRYLLDGALARLGVASDSEALALPLSEAEFRAAAAAIEGLELVSYRRADQGDQAEVVAVLQFDRVERVAELASFAPLHPRLHGDDPAVFELAVSSGGDQPLDEATVHFLGTLLGSHTVSFVVVAPRPIRDAGAGTLAEDGSRVTLSIRLADYAADIEPRMLRVSW